MTRLLRRLRFPALVAFAALAALAVIACGGDDDGDSTAAAGSGSGPVTLRLGYFANVTHAQAVAGVASGDYARELGDGVKLETKVFNAGPAAVEALFAGEIDATYIGPNPAINAFIQSKGEAVRIVAGSASAGALLVVRPDAGINEAKDLAGKKIATPQLGNTQDVALRAYLKQNGLKPKESGGDVSVLPTENATSLALFQQGEIDGAWVPEPWATRLVVEGGGKVFLDERDLWPGREFVTTHIVVATKFLEKNPAVVEALIRAHIKETDFINNDAAAAKAAVNKGISELSGRPIPEAVIDGAWKNLTFTWDPVTSSLTKSAQDAYDAGLLRQKPDLKGIYSLDILNKVLADLSRTAVKGQ